MARLDQIDRTKLGERMRLARSRAGKTQEQAAQCIGAVRTTMVAIERGERQLRPQELATLADLYGVTINSLLRESSIHVDLVAQFRRTMASVEDEASADEAVALLHKLATSTVELERRLGRTQATALLPERVTRRGDLESQAEDLAVEVRRYLGLGLSPIPDLVSIVELELGLRVFFAPIASAIGGVFAYHPELGGCVLLNSKHPPERQAWSLAHDVGHFMAHRNAVEACSVANGAKPPQERFADMFAAALLMPAASVRRQFFEIRDTRGKVTYPDLILLAHRYHVSSEAMCRRLEGLGLFKAGTYEALVRKGFSKGAERDILGEQPPQRPNRLPPRLQVLVADAYGAGLISEGQAADMLAVDRIAVREILDALADDQAADLGVVS